MAEVEIRPQREVIVETTRVVPSEFILARRAVYFIFDIIELLLGIRFVLKLFGADPTTSFSNFIETVAGPLLAPFRGIFAAVATQGMIFDWATLVAMAVYALIAYIIVRLLSLVMVT